MKDAGIDAESDKTETDDYIEFRVRIPKDLQNDVKKDTRKCTNSA